MIVIDKAVRLGRRWQNSQEVQVQPADQRGTGCFWRRRQSFCFESGEHERVDVVLQPGCIPHFRQSRAGDGLKCPVISAWSSSGGRRVFCRRFCSLVNPRFHESNLFVRKLWQFERHLSDIAFADQSLIKQALSRIAGNNGRPAITAFQNQTAEVRAKPGLNHLRSVTTDTVPLKNRLDLLRKINRLGSECERRKPERSRKNRSQ